MFGIFSSEESKQRKACKEWLVMCTRVLNFRRDKLSEQETTKLKSGIEELKNVLRNRNTDTMTYGKVIDAVESHLKKVGGDYYPRGAMTENIEFFFVALIVYLGVTSFFVKPFAIPTNSMYPTYYGMTGEVYQNAEETPSALGRVFRTIAFGSSRYHIKAKADGELLIPIRGSEDGRVGIRFENARTRRMLIIPTAGHKYHFMVGGIQTDSFVVSSDFRMENWVWPHSEHISLKGIARNRIVEKTVNGKRLQYFATGKHFKKGDTILNFDLLTGDKLFVERFSYNFVKPSLGDGFVFRTDKIDDIKKDSFYIKRLAGTPGDKIEIKDSALLINDEVASGNRGFEGNASKDEESKYFGYTNSGTLFPTGKSQIVPEDMYLALGDNSKDSRDSRYFGYVPKKSVVGRPLFIYYPFTKRFGSRK